MAEYRIIEERLPLNLYYTKGVSVEPPKEVSFSSPIVLLQERKSIFHKWETIKEIDSVLEAEYFFYNLKVKESKVKIKIIRKL